ncbi:dextranase-like isoform X2 [Haliotis asinina]|uniref:dextranase-like isoform X2 n=1 Tax=Haliotis asinina TaxID=109174 RepID=UPI003531A6F9
MGCFVGTLLRGRDGLKASDKFSIYVSQGGTKERSFTYISTSDSRVQYSGKLLKIEPGRSVSWTSFSFSGAAVTVEVHTQKDFRNCLIRPKSYGFKCRRAGNKVAMFTVTTNTKLMSVEFDYDYGSNQADIKDKLLVFADPPETSIPSRHDTSVLYYDVGMHNLHGQKVLDGHIKEVYLAPGAYVQGGFRTAGNQGVKVHGRGVLSGAMYKFHDPDFQWALVNMKKGDHHTLEGITVVDPEEYYYVSSGNSNVVRNVKFVAGWTINSDGFDVGEDGLIEDSFVMANDDSIKLFHAGLIIKRIVVWQMQFGAIFQMGWWTARKVHGISVSDVDIIHMDWCAYKGDNCHLQPNAAVFTVSGHTHEFEVDDIILKDIRIEGECPRLVEWKLYKGAVGKVSNLRFENINVESVSRSMHNDIAGTVGAHVQTWDFVNLRYGGHCISDADAGHFSVDTHTTNRIRFACGTGHIIG